MEEIAVPQEPLRARTLRRLRSRKFWAAAGVVLLLIAALSMWSARSYRRSQALETLNTFTPFQNPPLGLVFPRVVIANDAARQTLAAGVREGIWGVSERGGRTPSLEVWLTVQGQKWFSIVGNQIVATFKAGSREASEVLELQQTDPSRRVRFRYVWREFHPGTSVLGSGMPELGREYEGEALFLYEGDQWRVMHWTTPEYDQAVGQFKTLASP